MKKPRTQAFSSKGMNLKVTLGSSATRPKKSPLMPGKKSYSKSGSGKRTAEELASNANFGQTGLTGES